MKRVLIVEDESFVAMLIEEMLIGLDMNPIGPASNVQEALDIISTQPIDMALLDVNLGNGETGFPIADVLMERGIPFAFVSGYAQASADPTYSAVATLQKPFPCSMLKNTINQLLA